MALYQPTNIIPSSFTQGTVDVNNDMEISWQVNGNSAMTAFQIDFYLNDAESTFVTSTGRLTDGCPFYGTDRFGRVQFFNWDVGKPWADWSKYQLVNGNNYKFKITQWYEASENVVSFNGSGSFEANTDYFFQLPSGDYVKFRPMKTYDVTSSKFYYNIGKRKAWIVKNNILTLINVTYLSSLPEGVSVSAVMVEDGIASAENFVSQTSDATFITRDTPTLTLYQTDKNYQNPIALPNTLATSIGYFKAEYKQEQGVPIRWIRWQVATASNGVVGEILADTGDIYTPTLEFEYNGFFNGQQYAIRAICESESGQVVGDTDSAWKFFAINYRQTQYGGKLTAKCLSKENAVELSWDSLEILYPTVSGDYILNDNSTKLANGTEVTYDNILGAPINFLNPWAVIWRGDLFGSNVTTSVTFSGNAEPLNNELRRDFDGQATTKDTINSTGKYESDEVVIKISPSFGIQQGTSTFKLTNLTGAGAVSYSLMVADNYTFIATFYSDEPNTTLSYAFYVTFYPTYYAKSSYDLSFPINDFSVVSGANYYEISIDNTVITAIIYGRENSSLSLLVNVTYKLQNSHPQGKLFSIKTTNNEIEISRENENIVATITENGVSTTTTIDVNPYSIIGTIAILENRVTAIYHDKLSVPPNEYGFFVDFKTLNYTQYPITSVSIYGADEDANTYSFSVFRDPNITVVDYYEDVSFKPSIISNDYSLYMTANMEKSIDGTAGSAVGTGYRIYREEYGKNVLMPIATLSAKINNFKDYGITSRKVYNYHLSAYDSNDAFMTSAISNNIATSFKNYSLLVCDYDQDYDEYHVRKQYLFALDLKDSSVGNNNSPTLNANFTAYPTRMPSTQNYASGTLQGLIGAIYTVPALVEQIGNYKWTSKPSTMDYFDSVDLEKELYDLSVAPYQLFLRDMKGRLRMIATSGAISMTTNIKQKQQSISISLPWVEIGDASDVTIIQTPNDDGWNNNQVLDVQLDVDVATGELSATYPYPYNGTKFYLTGVNKDNLTAKTPNGVTPAQFNLSEVAEEPNDGEVTATVTVNTENK